MKIRIITERTFPDKEWDEYVRAMKAVGSSVTDSQFDHLLKTGKLVINHLTIDGAITTYEIVHRDERIKPSCG